MPILIGDGRFYKGPICFNGTMRLVLILRNTLMGLRSLFAPFCNYWHLFFINFFIYGKLSDFFFLFEAFSIKVFITQTQKPYLWPIKSTIRHAQTQVVCAPLTNRFYHLPFVQVLLPNWGFTFGLSAEQLGFINSMCFRISESQVIWEACFITK